MRQPLAASFVCAILLALPAPVHLEESEEEPAPPEKEEPPPDDPGAAPTEEAPAQDGRAEKIPDFNKEQARGDFIKAKVLFEEGKYKEAEALFKKSRGDAKSKEDKALVESWMQGAGGMVLLDKLKPRLQSGKRLAAYEQAEAVARKYKGTPAEPHFKKLIEELDAQGFVVVQGFDVVTKAYEKAGKSFVEDPSVVYDGTRSLRWTSAEDKGASTLRIDNPPKEWEPFEAVVFHVKLLRPPAGMDLIVMTDPDGSGKTNKKAQGSAAAADLFQSPVRFAGTNPEWQRVTVRISDFVPQGKASFSHVTGIQFQIGKGRDFEILLDKVMLVRKEAGAEPSKTAKQKKAKK